MEVKELTDKELLVKVKEVSGSEREATLYYIVELDRRKLYTDAGYSSLFSFLHQELGYSEAGAGRRIAAARCLAECPELGEKFLRREVSIATMSTVSKQLREEKDLQKKQELAQMVVGSSKREVESLVAKVAPKKVVRETVTPVWVEPAITGGSDSDKEPEERFRLSFTVSKEVMERFEEVKALLSHTKRSGGELEKVFQVLVFRQISFFTFPVKKICSTLVPSSFCTCKNFFVEGLVDEYLKKHSPKERIRRREARAKKKEGTVRKGSGEKRSRHIPREIRDQVLVRDGMRCTFQGEDGKRCTETRYLTVEHRTPFALGGGHNPENLCALCSAHNQHMARKVFGNKFMSQFG